MAWWVLVSSQDQPTIVWSDGQRFYNEFWDLFAASKQHWISHLSPMLLFHLYLLFVCVLLKNCHLPFEQRIMIVYLWSTYPTQWGAQSTGAHNNQMNMWLNCCCCSSGTSLTYWEIKLQDWKSVLIPYFLQPSFLKGSAAVRVWFNRIPGAWCSLTATEGVKPGTYGLMIDTKWWRKSIYRRLSSAFINVKHFHLCRSGFSLLISPLNNSSQFWLDNEICNSF